jgi:hypothetical protein
LILGLLKSLENKLANILLDYARLATLVLKILL